MQMHNMLRLGHTLSTCVCVLVVIKHDCEMHMHHKDGGYANGIRNTTCRLALTVNQPVSMCVTVRPHQH